MIASLSLFAACGGASPAPNGTLRQPIIGGTPDADHLSVGLVMFDEWPGCSATLIGRRTVLTAAHCVDTSNLDPSVQLGYASDETLLAQRSALEGAFVHPSADFDIAVMRLKQKIIGVVPSRLPESSPHAGEEITVVGYGLTDDPDNPYLRNAKKKVGTNRISSVWGDYFDFASTTATCNGDSGGPSFALRSGVERIVGVHSRGDCGSHSIDANVAAALQWIASVAQGDLYQGEPVDTEPPQVAVLDPASDAEVTLPVRVRVQAEDNVGVARVLLRVDAMDAGERQSPPFDFDLGQLETGPHRVDVVAYDAEGLQAKGGVSFRVVEPRRPTPDAGPPDATPAADGGDDPASGGGCRLSSRGSLWFPLLVALLVLGRRSF